MSYTPEYLYGNGDLIPSNTHKELLRDLCNKLHKQFYPWRIRRFGCDINTNNQMYAMIIFSSGHYISFRTDTNTGLYTVLVVKSDEQMIPCGRYQWETPTDNDYIVEDMVTLLEQDTSYIKFMKKFKQDTLRDELLKKVSIEVDYHPDSPIVDLLKSDFDSMKQI